MSSGYAGHCLDCVGTRSMRIEVIDGVENLFCKVCGRFFKALPPVHVYGQPTSVSGVGAPVEKPALPKDAPRDVATPQRAHDWAASLHASIEQSCTQPDQGGVA